MSRILLTGANGQVGWELKTSLAPLGEVVALDRQALDLAEPDRIVAVVRDLKPALIVNAAAYTAVDRAEGEPALAQAINGRAPGILAEEAKRLGARLVHYSTDYVFDGRKDQPYSEADATAPLNVYGETKLAGEDAIRAVGAEHLILRTSWVYGRRGQNFLLTMQRLAKEREELRVVADQIGAPTWSRTIAAATAQTLAHKDRPCGLFHLTAGDSTSWHGFAAAILAQAGYRGRLQPITSAEYPLPARRPMNSRLDCSRLRALGIKLPTWQQALAECLS
ncbi:MAG TPA: dTDP-4-dehydrorhamnose reductase [Rhodocyclaceae bacterium]